MMKFSFCGLFKAAFACLVVASVGLVTPPPSILHMIIKGRSSRLSEEGKRRREKKLVALEKKLIEEDPSVAIIKDDKEELRRRALKEKWKPPIIKEKHVLIKETMEQPMFKGLQIRATEFGFTLDKAIVKTPGRINGKVIDFVAGDLQCYKTFTRVFESVYIRRPIKQKRYPFSFNPTRVSMPCGHDPAIARSFHFTVSRSVKEHRFLPACDLEEKIDVEGRLLKAFSFLPEQFKGFYFSLKKRLFGGLMGLFESRVRGDQTRLHRFLGSMLWLKVLTVYEQRSSKRETSSLCNISLEDLCRKPCSDLSFGARINKDWPDARGIYVNEARTICLTVNRDCHLKVYYNSEGNDTIKAFNELCRVYRGIQRGVQRQNLHFAYDEQYGFVSWNPNIMGCGLLMSAKVDIPNLQLHDMFKVFLHQNGFKGLYLKDNKNRANFFEVFNSPSFGETEIEVIESMNYGLRRLSQAEQRLKHGVFCDLDLPSKFSIDSANRNDKEIIMEY